METNKVLVVEDDRGLREALCDTLEIAGFCVASANDGAAALDLCQRENFGVVVSDVQMQPMDGHELLAQLRQRKPDLPVVLMTAHGTIGKAVAAMHAGAADYLPKPFEAGALIELVGRLLPSRQELGELIAEDVRTIDVAAMARRIAATDATVLISGESGTGKEVFARFIHEQSARRGKPFVAINCAAIPENMLESVLFGHEKGAFTGAQSAHAGKFEQAQGGTLLLDEISEMDLGLQAKLLRVLQERELERVGGARTIALDVRVIATSNRNLREQVAAGRFREDLFYRLNVLPLRLPPLRERRGDILPLARAALRRCAQNGQSRGGQPALLSMEAEHCLLSHSWPGNVRELNNLMQRAAILASGSMLQADDLRFEVAEDALTPGPSPGGRGEMAGRAPGSPLPPGEGPGVREISCGNTEALDENLKERERSLIMEALRVAPSRKEAAARLGISPRTLRHKLAQMRAAGLEVA